MDFARKQLEKFGWKEGSGLGKDNQGIIAAIKPTLKVGTQGMGYDLSKELVDTWWTRAYDDSLKRINIDENSEKVGVSLKEEADDGQEKSSECKYSSGSSSRPFFKMRQRMMKASFPSFSKGATLSNGELIQSDTSSDESDTGNTNSDVKESKHLTDEELFKACGGRTAHKAARFGLKLNGKLARIAAQEEASKRLLLTPSTSSYIHIQKKLLNKNQSENLEIVEKKSKKKKKRKHDDNADLIVENQNSISVSDSVIVDDSREKIKRKKHKKKSKSKYECLNETNEDGDSMAPPETIKQTISNSNLPQDSENEDSLKKSKKSKKSKKNKRSKYNDEDNEALVSK